MNPATVDMQGQAFRGMLVRNVRRPLLLSAVLGAVFVGMVLYLLAMSEWVERADKLVADSNELMRLIVDSETGLRGYQLTHNEVFLEPYRRAEVRILEDFDELHKMVRLEPHPLEQLRNMRNLFELWTEYAQKEIAHMRQGRKNPKQDLELGKVRMDRVRLAFLSFLDTQENLKSERVVTTQWVARNSLIAIVLLSLCLGVILAIGGRRQLLGLAKNYADVLAILQRHNQSLQDEAYMQNGLQGLNEQLRGDWTQTALAQRVLDFLTPYLHGATSALYLARDRADFLQLAAGYALHATTPTPLVHKREGLVGQVADSHKLIKIGPMAADEMPIRSALTESPPREVVIAPILADGVLQAVLEVGFLRPVADVAERFLHKLSEPIGVSLRSAGYRQQLKDLLVGARQKNEDLANQQAELAAANDELVRQSDQLKAAQHRLADQHTELEQSNQQLEEQAQILEHQSQDLMHKNQELIRTNQYKSEFLANMSHELRTPLNSTLILAKLLCDNQEGNLTAEQVEFASTIYNSGNELLTLINDILDLSKVEVGKLELVIEDISIVKLCQNIQKMFSPLAHDKSLKFAMEVDPRVPVSVQTDGQRVEQILRNLIGNAIKFTDTGTITLKVSLASKGFVEFAVTDTGVGIDRSQQGVIFEAFRQADGTTNRQYGGTGLGLTIGRNLAKLLGGEIRLESAVGRGSTFVLSLPIRITTESKTGAAEAALPPLAALPTAKTRVGPAPFADDRERSQPGLSRTLLVIEDDHEFGKVLYDLAKEIHFHCVVAQNVRDGLILAKQFLPSAIILDIKLPDASGLLNQLKDDPQTRPIPVHAISAGDYSRAKPQVGAVVMKPADRDNLKQAFRKLETKINQKIKRILIVEDDEVQRRALEHLIQGQGIEITSVGLAEEALRMLRASSFDTMIVDLKLPDLHGFDLLEKMSKDEALLFPPVIVYTGQALDRQEEERLRKYSRSIIIKGARSPERLMDEVALFLHQVQAEIPAAGAPPLHPVRHRERTFEKRKVLLVDDDVRNIFAMTSALQRKGALVSIARNGQECLDFLAKDPGFDIVLMDIMMPVMDGHEAIQKIRQQAALKTLPVIAVTARAMRDDFEKALASGASDYLAKPVDVAKLVSLMRVWMPPRSAGV